MATSRKPKRSVRPAARTPAPPSRTRAPRETAAEKRARLLAEEKAAEKRRKKARAAAKARREAQKAAEAAEEARKERARVAARARRAAAKAAREAAEATEEARKERARKRARDRRAAAKAAAEAAEEAKKKAKAKRARERRAAAKAAALLAEQKAEAARRAAEEIAAGRIQFPTPPRDGFHRVDVLGRVRQPIDELEKDRTEKYGPEVAKAARALEESLEFVKSNLVVDGWATSLKVHANEDKTVDADLSIEFRSDQTNKASLTGMGGLISRIEEHLGTVMHAKLVGFFMQYGLYLPSESQIPQRDARRPYRPYDGALRFGYAYMRIARTIGAFMQSGSTFVGLNLKARETLNGVLDGHKRPPTGMYLRFHWSQDGQLHRSR
jgi:hypothetical protein